MVTFSTRKFTFTRRRRHAAANGSGRDTPSAGDTAHARFSMLPLRDDYSEDEAVVDCACRRRLAARRCRTTDTRCHHVEISFATADNFPHGTAIVT